jgi:hypothetical protein
MKGDHDRSISHEMTHEPGHDSSIHDMNEVWLEASNRLSQQTWETGIDAHSIFPAIYEKYLHMKS